jgi:hypothetical protein
MHKTAADIICLAETKWWQGSECQLQGFKGVFNSLPHPMHDHTQRPKHSMAIYVHDGINFVDMQVPTGDLAGRYAKAMLLF